MAKAAARTGGRHAERARMEQAARDVVVPSRADVCVVGGGAAGLAAAISSAEAGASTVVLDGAIACGRTILATGNGRCNFANRDLAAGHYRHSEFVARAMGADPLRQVLGFFADCGLLWLEEDGRLYPRSLQAASVRNVLLSRARRAGVVLAPDRRATRVSGEQGAFEVSYQEVWDGGTASTLSAGRVVLAMGGTSASPVADLGLEEVPRTPVLCALASPLAELAPLDGRRARCVAALERDGETVMSEPGEVLFRKRGLSGIVSFDLSREARPGDVVALDLVPGTSADVIADHIRRLGVRDALDGMLDPAIGVVIAAMRQRPEELAALAKRFEVPVSGLAGTETAQVMRGGFAVSGFDPLTLESLRRPGLFACGEALDVDGPCGGYNLAWAWLSGIRAGSSAGRRP